MKLYTEEHMLAFANWCRIHDSYNKNEVWTIGQLMTKFENTETLFKQLEIPSYEEIEKRGAGHATFSPSYIAGAEWMRDKILGVKK